MSKSFKMTLWSMILGAAFGGSAAGAFFASWWIGLAGAIGTAALVRLGALLFSEESEGDSN